MKGIMSRLLWPWYLHSGRGTPGYNHLADCLPRARGCRHRMFPLHHSKQQKPSQALSGGQEKSMRPPSCKQLCTRDPC